MVPPSSKPHVQTVVPGPAYVRPTSGILSKLPAPWVPYAELIRLHQPHGLYMIAFPHVVGLLYAAAVLDGPLPAATLAGRAAVLLVWVFFWRSAGCAWNDNVDQAYDRQTARCRLRPIARGAVSTRGGHIYTLGLTTAAVAPLWYMLPPACTAAALVSVVLAMVYPFGKRFTDFAQVILGATLGSAVFLAALSLGMPVLSPPWLLPTGCLATAVLLLVVFYDTVYARADTADDLKSGVRGMAVRFRHNIEGLFLALTVLIVTFLTVLGRAVGMQYGYYALSVVGLAASLLALVALTRWNLLPSWAGSSGWLYALAIANLAAGFASEYVVRKVVV